MPKLSELKDYEIEEPKQLKLSELDSYEIEEAPEESERSISQAEAALSGGTQGLTLGFADEIGAAALTPLEIARRTLSKYIPGTPESVDKDLQEQGFKMESEDASINPLDVYQDLRDPVREDYAQAQEEHPYTTGTAELLGGVAPAIATGGSAALGGQGLKQIMKEGAKAGAKFGGAVGLGKTEDITDVPQTLKDVAVGTGLGAATGGLLPPALKGAGKVLGGARKAVKGGTNYLRDQFPSMDKIISAAQRSAKGEKLMGQEVSEVLSAEMDDAIVNLSDNMSKARGIIGDAQKRLLKKGKTKVDISDDVDTMIVRLEKESEDIISTDSRKEMGDLIARFRKLKTTTEPKVIPGEDIAFQKLAQKRQSMIDDLNAKEGITLDPQGKNFSEIQIDRDGGRAFFRDNTSGKTYSLKVGADKNLTNTIENGKVLIDARKAHEIAGDMYSASEDFASNTVGRRAIAAFKLFKEKARESLGPRSEAYDSLNQKYSALKRLEEILRPEFSSGNQVTREKGQMALANLADGLKQESNLPTKRLFRQFFDQMKEVAPNIAKESRAKIMNIADKIDINQASLGSAGKMSSDTSRLAGTVESFGVRGAVTAGNITRGINNIIAMPKEAFAAAGQKLVNSPDKISQQVGNMLTEMSSASQQRRNALIFSASQHPAYKRIIQETLGVNFNEKEK